ncbi:MAG: peptide-methionine (S)-S-oxide reductase, partial [Polaromonas sp.]
MMMKKTLLAAGAVILSAWAVLSTGVAAENAVKLPAPALDMPAATQGTRETAVFAGGCFWGVQAVFQHTRGVLNAVSGYAGGQKETAHYDSIGTGQTGHAESVQISYDPK